MTDDYGEIFDAIVVGAGVAGSAAAIALAQQGRRVAIVEKTEFPRRKVCGEFLSATSVPVLDLLGIGEAWRHRAGPEVRRVSVFSGDRIIDAPMPQGNLAAHGRALGRDVLDTMMLARAGEIGARIYQPFKALSFRRIAQITTVTIADGDTERQIHAPVVIAAHGSWERGSLPTHLPKQNLPNDLMGFKAYFRGADLAQDTMPLLAFPGGYGGIVWADGDRLSVSCCIRRDCLDVLRKRQGCSAAEAVHGHILASCAGARRTIADAEIDGQWLATGPIRPGIRPRYQRDIFRVGNVAGESHPIIAEGQSMAIQSSWLLSKALEGVDFDDAAALERAGRRYSRVWHRQFSTRIHAAAVFSHLAMRPGVYGTVGAILERVPRLLELGAYLSGKTRAISQLRSRG